MVEDDLLYADYLSCTRYLLSYCDSMLEPLSFNLVFGYVPQLSAKKDVFDRLVAAGTQSARLSAFSFPASFHLSGRYPFSSCAPSSDLPVGIELRPELAEKRSARDILYLASTDGAYVRMRVFFEDYLYPLGVSRFTCSRHGSQSFRKKSRARQSTYSFSSCARNLDIVSSFGTAV